MKTITKGLLILTVVLGLSSCDTPEIKTDNRFKTTYIVRIIDEYFVDGSCQYKLSTTDDPPNKEYIIIIDSIGKFNIGDTISFSVNKSGDL